jgi:hypothetical protein
MNNAMVGESQGGFSDSKSLMGDSEDEEAKKKAEEKRLSKLKKNKLTESELHRFIDIELVETETDTVISIPGITGVAETEEYAVIAEEVKAYDNLLDLKKGSDAYEARGSQTVNPTMKTKEVNCNDLHQFIEYPKIV